MKTKIYSIAFFTLSISMIGCSQAQVEKAKGIDTSKVTQSPVSKLAEQAEPDLTLESDYAIFKVKTTEKLNENDRKIGELRKKIKTENKELRLELEKQIAIIENENNVLKNKIKENIKTDKKAWESFKKELSQDMQKLEESISAIFDKKNK